MGEVIKRPKQIGLEKLYKYMKELKAMSNPEMIPFQEVLIVVSCLRFWCVRIMMVRIRLCIEELELMGLM